MLSIADPIGLALDKQQQQKSQLAHSFYQSSLKEKESVCVHLHLIFLFYCFVYQRLGDPVKCIFNTFAVNRRCLLEWNILIGTAPLGT